MQVGEEHQVRPEETVFGRDGFLDLQDERGLGPDVFGGPEDTGTRGSIFGIADTGSDAGAGLNEHGVPAGRELMDSGSGDGNAKFVVLDFLGDTDDHSWLQNNRRYGGVSAGVPQHRGVAAVTAARPVTPAAGRTWPAALPATPPHRKGGYGGACPGIRRE